MNMEVKGCGQSRQVGLHLTPHDVLHLPTIWANSGSQGIALLCLLHHVSSSNHRDATQACLGDIGRAIRLSRSHTVDLEFDTTLCEF